MEVESNGSMNHRRQLHSTDEASFPSPRAGTSANPPPVGNVPVGPRVLTRPPAVMRRVRQSPTTVTIHGPPSSNGRLNNAFLRPAPRSTPLPVVNDDWKAWDEVSIKIRGLPLNITTLALWKVFQDEGSVDYIEIFEDGVGRKDGSARVRFR